MPSPPQSSGGPAMRFMKCLRSPIAHALLASAISLAIWAALGIGANFGINSVLAVAGLLWLATIGLPTSAGVALAATVWGRVEPFSGLPGFLALACALGLAFQVVTFLALGRLAARARANGQPWRIRRALVFISAGAVLVVAALWITHRPAAPPNLVIDGHAHLFGDEGWPPVHKQTSGLSPAQKANPTYGLLNRLLHLPATGDLNEHYLQALVRQTQEARSVLCDFRVVLLAQDCRYTETGDPDWTHTTVYVPNEYLFRVVDRFPDLFLPCASINPQRKDWEAELDYCLAQGARVLKIHPPHPGRESRRPTVPRLLPKMRRARDAHHGSYRCGALGAHRKQDSGRSPAVGAGFGGRLHRDRSPCRHQSLLRSAG